MAHIRTVFLYVLHGALQVWHGTLHALYGVWPLALVLLACCLGVMAAEWPLHHKRIKTIPHRAAKHSIFAVSRTRQLSLCTLRGHDWHIIHRPMRKAVCKRCKHYGWDAAAENHHMRFRLPRF